MADESTKKPVRKTTTRKKSTSAQKAQPVKTDDDVRDFGGQFVDRKQVANKNPYVKGIITILVIAVVAGILGVGASRLGLVVNTKEDTFKAVFLVNGQVYFGNIEKETSDKVILDNVFYVQLVPTQVAQPDGTTQTVNQPQLIRKGTEFYGPESRIEVNKDQVTVIEELREDTQVMQDIRSQLGQE